MLSKKFQGGQIVDALLTEDLALPEAANEALSQVHDMGESDYMPEGLGVYVRVKSPISATHLPNDETIVVNLYNDDQDTPIQKIAGDMLVHKGDGSASGKGLFYWPLPAAMSKKLRIGVAVSAGAHADINNNSVEVGLGFLRV